MTVTIKTTIREQIYEIIKDRILQGYYEPGKKLSETELSSELGVSRSPLREAIRLLESDGLVSGEPNKGVYVKYLSEKDVKDLYQVEMMMQNASIQCGANNIDADKRRFFEDLEQEFGVTYASGDLNAYLRSSEKLHNEIVHLCNNNITNEIYKKIGIQNHRFRMMSLKDPVRLKNSYYEHIEIIHALLSGDNQKAQKVMMTHLSAAAEVVTLQVRNLKDSAE